MTRKLIFRLMSFLNKQVRFYEYGQLEKDGIIRVGRYTYGATELTIDQYRGSEAAVEIGSFTSISKNVRIITGGIHPLDWVSTFPLRIHLGMEGAYTDGMPSTKGPVTIGSDVWIGTGAVILSGVTVADGAVILPGAVVTKDVPAYSIVAGIPAKVTKYRFTEQQIASLLSIKWWEWPDDRIRKNVHLLSGPGIDAFIEQNK